MLNIVRRYFVRHDVDDDDDGSSDGTDGVQMAYGFLSFACVRILFIILL